MKPNQIFAAMPQDRCEHVMSQIAETSPDAFKQIVMSAAIALNFRPQYLLKQPASSQIRSLRRALARVGSSGLAEELLAIYFLKCHLELLTEWLDLLGLKHEQGILQDDVIESPDPSDLGKHIATFRAVLEDEDRELLLQTFSAQAAIEWPALDALLEG